MTATIDPIVSPDPATMRDFLEHLYGGYLDGYHSGLVELAYKDGERWGAVTFGTDQLDELVTEACRLNSSPGVNVYVGAWLRRGTAANRRASDPDAWAMTCAYVDLDTEGAASAAKQVYGELKPSWITVTGQHPHTRAQMWWRLAEPITEHQRGRDLLTAMCRAMKGDPTIVNPSRVMRLAGSVAWPVKDGRRVEPTRRGTLKEAGAKVYAAESLERTFTQYATPHAGGSPKETPQSVTPDQTLRTAAGSLGLPMLLADGREEYMRDTVLAVMREYISQNGCAPSAGELCELVWPQYSERVDFSRPGRGKYELLQKCISTVRRFEGGRISSLPDLDAAIARYEPKALAVSDDLGADFVYVAPHLIPPREWIYGKHYIRKFLSSTVAPGGVGKSSLSICEALAICTGKGILGVVPDERANVWLWNGEDPLEELTRRIVAAMAHYGISPEEVAGRLLVDSGRAKTKRVVIAHKSRDGTAEINVPCAEKIISIIRAREIGVFIVDPFVSSHQLSENDNTEIELVAQAWNEIAEATGCAIELVHHVRKGERNSEVTVEDGRGASALLAKARCARTLNRMTTAEAQAAGVEKPKLFFRVNDGKANLAPMEDAKWFQMVPYVMGNATAFRPSDEVGVATSWQFPDLLADVTGNDCDAVLAAMGDREFPADPQAKNWIGYLIIEVLGLEPDDAKSIAIAKKCQKTWTENKVLVRFDKETRKDRVSPFVRRGAGK